MLQAILIGLIVFIGKADYFIGTAMFGRPLVLGALVGIVLGDIPTGVMIGFQLELIFMGMQAYSVQQPMISGRWTKATLMMHCSSGIRER